MSQSPQAKAEAYFKKIGASRIEQRLEWLKSKLPAQATAKNYQLNHKLLGITSLKCKPEDLQVRLQEISDKMRKHLKIQAPIRILTVNHVEAGKYQLMDGLSCIFINSDLEKQNFKQKIAILAHELSHFYLIKVHGIYLEDTLENEFITELNAVYCGLGFFLLQGYESNVTQRGNVQYTSRVGYFTPGQVAESILQTAYLRKQIPQWVVKNVSWKYKIKFFFRLRLARKAYRAAMKARN